MLHRNTNIINFVDVIENMSLRLKLAFVMLILFLSIALASAGGFISQTVGDGNCSNCHSSEMVQENLPPAQHW